MLSRLKLRILMEIKREKRGLFIYQIDLIKKIKKHQQAILLFVGVFYFLLFTFLFLFFLFFLEFIVVLYAC